MGLFDKALKRGFRSSAAVANEKQADTAEQPEPEKEQQSVTDMAVRGTQENTATAQQLAQQDGMAGAQAAEQPLASAEERNELIEDSGIDTVTQVIPQTQNPVLTDWDRLLPQYPGWSFGGENMLIDQLSIDNNGNPVYEFSVTFDTNDNAVIAVQHYRQLLAQRGFRTAGRYPDICHLYKMMGGLCYHVDTEHCFDGDEGCASVYFNVREPDGGFNYVKPEPAEGTGIKYHI